MKSFIRKIHLWLGLTSGLVVFIVALTGCVYCFQEEIVFATQEKYRSVSKVSQFLPPSEVVKIAQKTLPNKVIHGVTYDGKNKSLIASFYSREYYYLVFIHPETGKVLKVQNEGDSFFRWVLEGHYNLWLPRWIGQPVVATATLIFFFLVISGLILWWPKKNAVKQRLKVKWNARWRRRNFDLHTVLGFYTIAFSLVFALTGLIWGFQWFASSAYFIASGGKEMTSFTEPISTKKESTINTFAADKLWGHYLKRFPQAKMEVHVPQNPQSAIEISINHETGTFWKTDYLFFDQHTLKPIQVKHPYGKLKSANSGDLLMRMNYDIHVGQIGGIYGKIIAFIASLIIASLPVTGFLMWWGRRNKAKKA